MNSIRSKRRAHLASVGCIAVLVAAINVSLVRFDAPQTVAVGSVFDVIVVLNGSNSGSPIASESMGCALGLPVGFTVESVVAVSGATLNPNPAAFTALFTPEAGAFLAFATPGSTVLSPSVQSAVRFRIRAPESGGAFTLKLALAGTTGGVWSVIAPAASAGNFANIVAAPFVRTINVTPTTLGLPSWRPKSEGLASGILGNAVPTLSWLQSDTVFGDFDRDGRTDIVAAERQAAAFFLTPTLAPSLSLGRVIEGWNAPTPFPVGGLNRGIAAGDFNADGFDDVFVDYTLFYGQASGGFAQVGVPPASPTYAAVAAADFDADGDDDLVLYDGNPQVFLFDPTGAIVFGSTGLPTGAPVGALSFTDVQTPDIDGDGDFDILVVRFSGIDIYLNNGASIWTASPGIGAPGTGPGYHQFAATGDIDADGDLDLLLGDNIGIGGLSWNSTLLRLYRNDGSGWTLLTGTGLPTTKEFSAATIGDVDADGVLDVVLARSSDLLTAQPQRLGSIEVWRGVGGSAFLRAAALETGLDIGGLGEIVAVIHRDVDDDGFPDLVLNGDLGISVYARTSGAVTSTVSRVGQSLGLNLDVLTVNGLARNPSTRAVPVGLGQPIAVALAQSPLQTTASRYVLFGKLGWPRAADVLDTVIGALPFGIATLNPGAPELFTLANSFAPDPVAVLPPALPGPFAFTLAGGSPVPLVFSLCALIDDPASPPYAITVSNTVVVDVR